MREVAGEFARQYHRRKGRINAVWGDNFHATLVDSGRYLEVTLRETISEDRNRRQACWTESLAVGSAAFLERIRPMILSRRETEIVEAEPGLWALKEAEIPYGALSGPESGSKAQEHGGFR